MLKATGRAHKKRNVAEPVVSVCGCCVAMPNYAFNYAANVVNLLTALSLHVLCTCIAVMYICVLFVHVVWHVRMLVTGSPLKRCKTLYFTPRAEVFFLKFQLII